MAKETQKAITKFAKVTIVQRALNPGVIVQHGKPTEQTAVVYHGVEGEGAADADDFSNFRLIGKRASKRNEDESEWDSNARQPAMQTYSSDKNLRIQASRLHKQSTQYGNTASAVSNNSAMAPEPVVPQRIVPGLTTTTKAAAGTSSLQQQRALVAELRAKEKMPIANRASAATQAGERTGLAGWGIDEAKKSQVQKRNQNAFQLIADGDAPFGDMVATCDQGLAPSLYAPDAASITVSDTAFLFEVGPSTPATDEPEQQPLRRSSFSGSGVAADTAALNSLISAQLPTEPQDAAPIVDYDQLFSLEDGALVVLDKQSGFFLHLEHVHGQDPEMIGFQDEAGNVTYYVVVRASAKLAQQQASAAATAGHMAADSSCLDGSGNVIDRPSATHCALGPSAQENKAPLAMVNPGLGATRGGHAFTGMTIAATAEAVQEGMVKDDEDELNDLLALCLA
ncbi:hypothetical protein Vretimale_9429 [Volvox reticuliferus]|nr:hypothetical protein Vretifemale_9932 [Volvox reticuliferus]GIM04930.1 hypothetical protein Vretimale_9429 [Volvox reticuliferus]